MNELLEQRLPERLGPNLRLIIPWAGVRAVASDCPSHTEQRLKKKYRHSCQPESHIRWNIHSTLICAYFYELPHTCLVVDQVFRFFAALGFYIPRHQIWTSMNLDFHSPMDHDDKQSQILVIESLLNDVALVLYKDWAYWLHDLDFLHVHGPRNESGRLILSGFPLGMRGSFPQAAMLRHTIRWQEAK